MQKAISAIIVTIMLLVISTSLIGVFYVFSSTIAGSSTSSGSQQVSQLTNQLAMCMRIDNILGNKIDLRNCGKGVIENKSLVVTMDDVKLGASTLTISEGESGTVNVSGLWQIAPGKHNLKISNGAAFALALVDVQPNKEGLVGSWSFNEGSGTFAGDGSGNGNTGTLLPAGSEPQWISGKSGKGLQFDGVNDYVNAGSGSALTVTRITVSAWINPTLFSGRKTPIRRELQISMALDDAGGGTIAHMRFHVNIGGAWYYAEALNAIKSGEWSYIMLTYDGSNVKAWKNGIVLASSSAVGNINTALSGPLYIGTGWAGGEPYTGIIDEVRIWNRALAPDETVVMKQII